MCKFCIVKIGDKLLRGLEKMYDKFSRDNDALASGSYLHDY